MFNFGLNTKKLKKLNRELVLKTIYNNKPISRDKISKILNLTPATITKIINEFEKMGLVYEKEMVKSGVGRSSILIDVKDTKHYILGIYLGNESIYGVLANMNIEIINKIEYPKKNWNHNNASKIVIDMIKELLYVSAINIDKIIGFGITAIGPITYESKKVIEFLKKYPFTWEDSIADIISKKFNKNVYIDNSSNAIAIAENWFGYGKNYNNFAVFCFGGKGEQTGLGAGLILENILYQGSNNIVAEIGHITINNNGQKCWCGNFGCLNLFLNNYAMLKKYNELKKDFPECDLAKVNFDNNIEEIFNYRNEKDPIYNEFTNYVANYLAIAAINLFNILDLEAIIIDFNESQNVNLFPLIKKVETIVRARVFPNIRDKVKILDGKFKKDAELIGAASLVLNGMFNIENIK